MSIQENQESANCDIEPARKSLQVDHDNRRRLHVQPLIGAISEPLPGETRQQWADRLLAAYQHYR